MVMSRLLCFFQQQPRAETLLVTDATIRAAGLPEALQGLARQMVRPLAANAAEAARGVEA